MIELNLYGNLAKYYGKKVSLNTETPRNALNLLMAQNQGFKRDLLNQQHVITLNNRELNENNLGVNLDARYENAQINITPVIRGGVAGAVSLITWVAVGLAAASVAYSIYMYRNMKPQTSAESAQDGRITNNTYTSVENRVGQGATRSNLIG